MRKTTIVQNILRRLSGQAEPEGPETEFQPAAPAGNPPPPVYPRVSLILFDPVLPSEGGQRLNAFLRWNDPARLVEAFIADLRDVSHGYVQYTVAEHIRVDAFPVKEDGFAYTDESFLRAWRSRSGFHQPDTVHYQRILDDHDLVGKVNRGEIDEVWMMGFPYAGFYESRMVGPGAFWCNAPPLDGARQAARRFVVMGFNYERGVGEMLESYGHRAESILAEVYRRARGENLWERFIRHERTHPGRAEVGNIHFAPNSRRDYDWGNPTPVLSRHHTWFRFPDLSGEPRRVDAREWGGGDIRQHHLWWFRHLPRVEGETQGVLNNWWAYLVDANQAPGR